MKSTVDRLMRSRMTKAVLLAVVCAVPMMAQTVGGDPITNVLVRIAAFFTTTWARLIVTIACGIWCVQILFRDRNAWEHAIYVLIGGAGLLGLATFVTSYVG